LVRVEYFSSGGSAQRMVLKTISAKLLIFALVVALTCLWGGCTSQKPNDTEPTPVLSGPPNTAFPMPPLSADSAMGWTLANGERARVADYRGRVLVLDFYATWCAPCRASIPRLISLQQQFGPRGLDIVGLNVGGPDDRIKVAAFASELNITYPLGFPDKALTDLFLSDNQTIPQTFMFGRDGQLAKRFIGYEESTGVELERAIIDAVNSKQ
jgi:thiol-disulfide isomerase/thioredoxin